MKSKIIITLVLIMIILTSSIIPIPGISNTGIDVVSAATKTTSDPEPVVTPEPIVSPEPVVIPETISSLEDNNYSKMPSDWSIKQISDAISIGLDLTNVETFDQPLTRKEFVNLIMDFYSIVSDTPISVSSTNPYSDTTDPAIIKAHELGIVKGIDNERFNPDGLLTRQEASLILYRLFRHLSPGVNGSLIVYHEFADADIISNWAFGAIQFMYDHNILLGNLQNKIMPKEFITLEQSIVLIMRVYKSSEFKKQIVDSSAIINSEDETDDEYEEDDEEDDEYEDDEDDNDDNDDGDDD